MCNNQQKLKKLNFQLVPDGCWHSNLRNILSKRQWDYIKKDTKLRFNNTCCICGKQTNVLDAHEVWEYDKKKAIQKLVDVVAVCKDCHSAIHIDLTALKGNIERAEDHYMKVNQCSYAEYKSDLNLAHQLHNQLNSVSEWGLDITWLYRYVNE